MNDNSLPLVFFIVIAACLIGSYKIGHHVGYRQALTDARPYINDAVTQSYEEGQADGQSNCGGISVNSIKQ